jgi:hypothetical protein
MVNGAVVHGETPGFTAEKARELLDIGVNVKAGAAGRFPRRPKRLGEQPSGPSDDA